MSLAKLIVSRAGVNTSVFLLIFTNAWVCYLNINSICSRQYLHSLAIGLYRHHELFKITERCTLPLIVEGFLSIFECSPMQSNLVFAGFPSVQSCWTTQRTLLVPLGSWRFLDSLPSSPLRWHFEHRRTVLEDVLPLPTLAFSTTSAVRHDSKQMESNRIHGLSTRCPLSRGTCSTSGQ